MSEWMYVDVDVLLGLPLDEWQYLMHVLATKCPALEHDDRIDRLASHLHAQYLAQRKAEKAHARAEKWFEEDGSAPVSKKGLECNDHERNRTEKRVEKTAGVPPDELAGGAEGDAGRPSRPRLGDRGGHP